MAKKDVKRVPAAPKVKAKAKTKPRAKANKPGAKTKAAGKTSNIAMPPPRYAPDARVLDRLWGTVLARKDADPLLSHSARLLARGTAKIAQKFGEEAVECLIEAVGGHRTALVGESADVLYHLLVLWVDAGLRPEQIWAELTRREAMSGVQEKAARPAAAAASGQLSGAVSGKPFGGFATTKIP